jgi:hypothetical protein
MNCFVPFVPLCSVFVGIAQDKPADLVNERDLTESDPGTGVNEGHEEMPKFRFLRS